MEEYCIRMMRMFGIDYDEDARDLHCEQCVDTYPVRFLQHYIAVFVDAHTVKLCYQGTKPIVPKYFSVRRKLSRSKYPDTDRLMCVANTASIHLELFR